MEVLFWAVSGFVGICIPSTSNHTLFSRTAKIDHSVLAAWARGKTNTPASEHVKRHRVINNSGLIFTLRSRRCIPELALSFRFLGAKCKTQDKLLDWVPRNYTLSLNSVVLLGANRHISLLSADAYSCHCCPAANGQRKMRFFHDFGEESLGSA